MGNFFKIYEGNYIYLINFRGGGVCVVDDFVIVYILQFKYRVIFLVLSVFENMENCVQDDNMLVK